MSVSLPDSSAAPPAAVMATLAEIKVVAPRHYLLKLEAPSIASTARAGQFVHVLSRPNTTVDPFLRRAFSIMKAEGNYIEILFRVEGRGTAWLAERQVGQTIDILGPLGNPFDLTPFHEKPAEQAPTPILVGGGVGVPPMVMLSEAFQGLGILPTVVLGARSASELLGLEELRALGIAAQICTDDGSKGHAGRVTDLLEAALQGQNDAVVYSCGPLPMLRAVAGVAARYNAPCQVSMEENMPCGIGVCNGCVVAMHTTATAYEKYRRICVEGPAVWAHEVDWEKS